MVMVTPSAPVAHGGASNRSSAATMLRRIVGPEEVAGHPLGAEPRVEIQRTQSETAEERRERIAARGRCNADAIDELRPQPQEAGVCGLAVGDLDPALRRRSRRLDRIPDHDGHDEMSGERREHAARECEFEVEVRDEQHERAAATEMPRYIEQAVGTSTFERRR